MNLFCHTHTHTHTCREVLASSLILNVPHKVDWKNCSATRPEEEKMAKEMRKLFEPFDFTDDDD